MKLKFLKMKNLKKNYFQYYYKTMILILIKLSMIYSLYYLNFYNLMKKIQFIYNIFKKL